MAEPPGAKLLENLPEPELLRQVAHTCGQRKCRRWPRFAERSGANLGPFYGQSRNWRATLELLCRSFDFSCRPPTGTQFPPRNPRP
jgi:hypothetical protein